ncbi:jg9809 [Pararge aegeria aegeria]|uniref:Jg9809 protein n=1 Tax=Pararge aegeria aegeria TaxID=348720 RepID=A0A8S4RJR2_9NEOP|nr:jg9809 [Pararge aegeria aegeria]
MHKSTAYPKILYNPNRRRICAVLCNFPGVCIPCSEYSSVTADPNTVVNTPVLPAGFVRGDQGNITESGQQHALCYYYHLLRHLKDFIRCPRGRIAHSSKRETDVERCRAPWPIVPLCRSFRALACTSSLKWNASERGNLRIDLASNPVKFGDDRSTLIFELANCQIQLLFTMMIFYCWVYMGVDNDLYPLEKRIEENEYGEK